MAHLNFCSRLWCDIGKDDYKIIAESEIVVDSK